jgi:hypothetical protein
MFCTCNFSESLLSAKEIAIHYTILLQAFLEQGIPESPEMVVALMQKVYYPATPLLVRITRYLHNLF